MKLRDLFVYGLLTIGAGNLAYSQDSIRTAQTTLAKAGNNIEHLLKEPLGKLVNQTKCYRSAYAVKAKVSETRIYENRDIRTIKIDFCLREANALENFLFPDIVNKDKSEDILKGMRNRLGQLDVKTSEVDNYLKWLEGHRDYMRDARGFSIVLRSDGKLNFAYFEHDSQIKSITLVSEKFYDSYENLIKNNPIK
jgi:hypothetical protein